MKLNKLQRHTAYVIMLVEYTTMKKKNKGNCQYQLCHIIYKLFGIDSTGFYDKWDGEWFIDSGSQSISTVLNFFPELDHKNPVNYPIDEYGKKQRIKLLKQCIEETY